MVEALYRLRTEATLDASGYVSAAKAKEEADKAMTASGQGAAAAVEQTEVRLKAATGSVDRFKASLDEAYKAQLQFDKAQRTINGLVEAGKLGGDEANRLLELARDRYQKAAEASDGLAASHDRSTAAAAKMRDGIKLLQEGLGEAGFAGAVSVATRAAEAFGTVARVFAAVATPVGAVVTGVGAVALGFGVLMARAAATEQAIKQVDLAMRGLGNAGLLGREEIGRTIDLLAELPGVTRTMAQELELGFARTRKLGVTLYADLGEAATGYATILGKTLPEAAQYLAEGVAGGYQSIKRLDEALGFLSASQLESVRRMDAQGQSMAAQKLAADALRDRYKGLAQEGMTPLQAGLDTVTHAWDRFLESLSRTAPVVAARDAVKSLLKALTPDDTKQTPAQAAQSRAAQVLGQQSSPFFPTPGSPAELARRAASPAAQAAAADALDQQERAERVRLDVTQQQSAASKEAAKAEQDHTDSLKDALAIARQIIPVEAQQQELDDQLAKLQAAQPLAENRDQYDLLSRAIAANRAERAALLTPTQEAIKAAQVEAQVLAAPIGARDELRAKLQAEEEVRTKRITGAAAELYVETQVTSAVTARTTAANDQIDAITRETAANTRISEAYSKSAAEGKKAEIAEAAREEVVKNSAKSEDALRTAMDARLTSQQRITAAQQIQAGDDEIKVLQKQLELAQQLPEIRDREVGLLREKLRLERELSNALPEQRQQLLDQAAKQGELNGQIKEAERQQKLFDNAVKQAANNIDNELGKALDNAFSGKKVADWGNTALTIIRTLAVEATKIELIRPALGGLLGAVGFGRVAYDLGYGTPGGASGRAGGGTGGFSLSDVYSVGKGAYSLLSGGVGAGGTGAEAAATGVATYEATDAVVGATADGMAEAGLMAGLGATGYGLAAVAAIMIAQQLLGNKHPKNVTADMAVRQQPWLQDLQGLSGHSLQDSFDFNDRGTSNGADTSVFDPLTKDFLGGLRSVLSSIGGTFQGFNMGMANGDKSFVGRVGYNSTSGKYGYQVGGQQFDADNLQDAMSGLIAQAIKHADIAGLSATMTTVLKNTTATSVQDLQGDIQYAKLYDRGFKAMGPFGQALDQLNQSFDAAMQKADDLGLAEDVVTAARDKAVGELKGNFISALDQTFGTGGGQFETAMKNLTKAFAAATDEATALGISQDEVTKRYDQAVTTLKGSFLDTLDQTFGTGKTGLAGQLDQLTKARDAALKEAQGLGLSADEVNGRYDQAVAKVLQTTRESLAVRQLDVEGRGDEAAAMRLEISHREELAGVTDDGIRATLLAVQAEETLALQRQTQLAHVRELDAANENAYQAQQAADQARARAEAETVQKQLTAQQQIASAAQQAAQQFGGLADSLHSFRLGLLTGSDSVLSPQERFLAAQQQYRTDLQQAKGGDQQALQNLQGFASAYLQTSRDFNAGNEANAAVFQEVQQGLADAETVAAAQRDIQQGIYDAAETQIGILQDQLDVLNEIQQGVRSYGGGGQGTGGSGAQASTAQSVADFAGLAAKALAFGANERGQGVDAGQIARDVESTFGDQRRQIVGGFKDANALIGLLNQYYNADPTSTGAQEIRGALHNLGVQGFAGGGSFTVGGAGGVDSRLVQFKASPWERVTVTNPGQSVNDNAQHSAAIVKLLQSIDAKLQLVASVGADGDKRLLAELTQARAMLEQMAGSHGLAIERSFASAA